MPNAEAISLILALTIKGGLVIFGVSYGIYEALMRRAVRKTVQRLLARPPLSSWQDWHLPAPESYALLRGVKSAKTDAFQLGILHLMAARVFVPEYRKAPKPGHGWETILGRGPASLNIAVGSLAAIYSLWESTPDPRTVARVAHQAKQKYGSPEAFTEYEVVPRLVDAGLYKRDECQDQWLQPASSYMRMSRGQIARDDLESRMSAVLHRMEEERPSLISKKPYQALLVAVVAAAAGRPSPLEEAELQLVTQGVEQAVSEAMVPQESTASEESWPIWLDWLIFDNFGRTFVTLDSGCGAGGGDGGDGSDGSDGGDNGDGGDGGDGGDFGGWS